MISSKMMNKKVKIGENWENRKILDLPSSVRSDKQSQLFPSTSLLSHEFTRSRKFIIFHFSLGAIFVNYLSIGDNKNFWLGEIFKMKSQTWSWENVRGREADQWGAGRIHSTFSRFGSRPISGRDRIPRQARSISLTFTIWENRLEKRTNIKWEK